MLRLKLDTQEFTFPSAWEEVTFRQFIDIINIKQDTFNSQIDGFVKVIGTLSDTSAVEAVRKLSITDFYTLRTYFEWLNTDPKESDSQKKKKATFKIGDETWTIKDNFQNLTVGEAVSLEILLQDKALDLNPMEIAFGILFRRLDPVTGSPITFNGDDLNKIIKEHSKKIFITDVFSIISFFLRGDKTSTTKLTQVCLSPNQKKANTQPKKKKKTA